MSKKIICLGGGNAMPKAVLAGLKKSEEISLSVICAASDSGGSAGKERRQYKTNISFGDIRRSFLELSELSADAKDVLSFRLEDGTSGGTIIANTLGTIAVQQSGNYEKPLKIYREIFKIPQKHQVFPATIDDSDLCVILENGKTICGEADIDVPKHDASLRIKEAFLQPRAKVYPGVVEEIAKADLIVIGPGDLYSSLIQILLVDGVSEAIKKSKVKKVYICNLTTKKGETDDFSVLDFTNEIEKYLNGKVDFVVYNNEGGDVKINKGLENDKKFIGENLLKPGTVEHDPDKLAKIICKL